MRHVIWTDALSVGILEVDEQHKKLLNLLNKASDQIQAGQPQGHLISTIKEILNFTLIHFATEEKMFKVCRYAQTKAHVAEHQKLIHKGNEFLHEFTHNKLVFTDSTMTFFSDWIVNHIMHEDMAYSKPLKAAGYK